MTGRRELNRGGSQLVLSLFPGVDLLGRGFEHQGFSVVRGPDLIFGGDIRKFSVPPWRFEGIIAGSPCPDFSRARRSAPTGNGLQMLGEFARVVVDARPEWWLLENVPGCPDVLIDGYSHQRIDIDARDVGAAQRRLRHFQYGHRSGYLLSLPRPYRRDGPAVPTLTASEKGKRRSFGEFCELQGLPASFDLPAFTLGAKYRAVGNGVHVAVARFMAAGVMCPVPPGTRLCACGCARPLVGKSGQLMAGVACRKRAQRKRDVAATRGPRSVTL